MKETTLEKINQAFIGLLLFFLPFEFYPKFLIIGHIFRPTQIIAVLLILINIPKAYRNLRSLAAIPWLFLLLLIVIQIGTTLLNPTVSGFYKIANISFEVLLAFVLSLSIKQKDYKKYIAILFVSASLVATYSVFQFIGDTVNLQSSVTLLQDRYVKNVMGYTRVNGFSLEPLFFAWYMCIPLIISLIALWYKQKNIYILSSFLFSIALLLTFSRITFVIYGMLICIFLLSAFKQRNWKYMLNLSVVVLAAVAICIILLDVNVYSFIKHPTKNGQAQNQAVQSQASFSKDSTSTQARKKSWKENIRIIIKNPVTGVGSARLEQQLSKTYNSYDLTIAGNTKPNNLFLEIFGENGILAIILIFISFGTIGFMFLKSTLVIKNTSQKIWLYGSVLFIAVSLLFWQVVGNFAVTSFWIMFGFFMSTVPQLNKKTNK